MGLYGKPLQRKCADGPWEHIRFLIESGFDEAFTNQISVWGVKPTFGFHCIMKSFQLMEVLEIVVSSEETRFRFSEKTVLVFER